MDVLHSDFSHVRQLHNWDCGIACVASIVKALEGAPSSHLNFSKNFLKHEFHGVLHQLQNESPYAFGRRPWTIDLCNILRVLKINYTLFTKQPKVNPGLAKLSFYSSSAFKKDTNRIAGLLSSSGELCDNITTASVDNEDFTQLLNEGPLIALVDGNKLRCRHCRTLTKLQWIMKWRGFSGHYVLVIGYHENKSIIYYRNPAASHEQCEMQLLEFRKARQAFGTEEDLITIKK